MREFLTVKGNSKKKKGGMKMNDDIIVAVATSRLEAAISIIRLSGKDVIAFVQQFFTGKILNKESHTITYGYIKDNGEKIDEVLVNIYRGKRTFTGEEMVEINCHGGVYITNRVVDICLHHGARLAERGEFSKRAFLNGRIDLSQAEAISHFIKDLKEELIQIITQIEVNIDYPEYEDVEELTADKLLPMSTSLIERMNKIIEDSKNIKLLKDGIQTAIIGKPNVGKSSLLNAMLKEEKAIVTNIAGTTRDVVEGSVTVDGILLNMIDTAGIRETDNIVESLGVEKSKEMIKKADLVLLVIDGSKELDQEDQKLLELTEDTNRIIIINKADLGKKVDLEGIEISAKEQDILALTKEIKKKFNLGLISNQEEYYLTNARQTQLLEKAAVSLQSAIDAMKMSIPADLIVEDLYDSWSCLKEILGEQAKEDLLDELFKRFCIGK